MRAWWKGKAEEIYTLIPDLGGFVVKANSEGQPGPQDYHRSHAEGANMLADVVAPHGGIIMWRAFVYSQDQPQDRAKQAYSEFVPLDGQFRDNVVLQVKNGAIDFQPREPFHPLFGATPHTPLMLEVQITKEYLGFDQANWYAFRRMAWNPMLSSRDIAEEWVRMTCNRDPAFVDPVANMMMGSREAAVNYMTPLGLLGRSGKVRRPRQIRPGQRISSNPGKGSEMVAGRHHCLFPDPREPSAAGRIYALGREALGRKL